MFTLKSRILAVALTAVVTAETAPIAAQKKLSKSDRRWLESVAALITEDEARIFEELDSNKDRKLFKDLFWSRRDPNLLTPENEYKVEFERGAELADRHFKQRGRKGSATDMGKVFLLLGGPKEVTQGHTGQQDAVISDRNPTRGGGSVQGSPPAGSSSRDTGGAVDLNTMAFLAFNQPAETMTWTYPPNPRLGTTQGLTIQFQMQPGYGYQLRRSEVVDVALERAKEIFVMHPDITYAKDRQGRLLKPPPRLDPHSPAKKILRETLEAKNGRADVSFDAEVAFFRSTEGSYVPLLFEIDPGSLKWDGETADVALFGAIETSNGQMVNYFEEQVEFAYVEDEPARFEMPLQLSPGNYTFNLGVWDGESKKAGTKRMPVFVPGFDGEGLTTSTVLLYTERREVQGRAGTPGHAFQFGEVHFTPNRGRTYRATDQIGIVFFVYGFGLNDGDLPNLTTDYVFYKDGKRLRELLAQPLEASSSQAIANLEAPLTGLEPGNYWIELEVNDHITNASLKDRVEFTLVPESYSSGIYSDLVANYRSDNYAEAARMLSFVPRDLLEGPVRNFGKRSLADDNLKRAALLHTDVAIVYGNEEPFHLKAARKYLERIKNPGLRQDVMRRWFLAVILHLRTSTKSWSLLPMLRESLALFPDDLDIRLAVGSVYETMGWNGVEETLAKAENLYRGIIDADPENAEAHLRLGRVLQLQNRGPDAVQELRRSLEQTNDPQLTLVAQVLLGEIFHQRGEDGEAIRSYQAALEVDPRCSAAAVALSQTLHRAGDLKGSREVILDFLTTTAPTDSGPDLWWRYVRGCKERAISALSEMREDLVP